MQELIAPKKSYLVQELKKAQALLLEAHKKAISKLLSGYVGKELVYDYPHDLDPEYLDMLKAFIEAGGWKITPFKDDNNAKWQFT